MAEIRNPYYRTKHTIWFTGWGKAVYVVALDEYEGKRTGR